MSLLTILMLPQLLFIHMISNDFDVTKDIELYRSAVSLCESMIKDFNTKNHEFFSEDDFVDHMAERMLIEWTEQDCLKDLKDKLDELERRYPGLFKSYMTNSYIKDPKVMMAMAQLQSQINGLSRRVVTQYNTVARGLNQKMINQKANEGVEVKSGDAAATSSAEASEMVAQNKDSGSSVSSENEDEAFNYPIIRSNKKIPDLLTMSQQLIDHTRKIMPQLEKLMKHQVAQLEYIKSILNIFEGMNKMG